MKLTELFGGERQVTDGGRAVQADSAKSAAISRQIRSLVPGQTIQGEVISRSGGEIQIRLADDMLLNARLDQNMNLEIGRNMTFEVRNNGKALTLSPLFANMATDANTLKALDMASLPVNQTTVEMTRQMMDAGLSIDRNSLQQMFREINAFSGADISDIVDLHRLSLPVTEGNVEQIASYKNLTYQLVNGMNDVLEALPDVLDNMVQSGNVEGAARLFEALLNLAGGDVLPEDAAGMTEAELMKAGAEMELVQTKTAEADQAGAAGKEGIFENIGEKAGFTQNVDGAEKGNAASRAMNILEEKSKESESVQENGGKSGEALQKTTDTNVSQILRQAAEQLQKGIAQHDTGLLRDILGSKELQKAMTQSFQKLWTIRPEDVSGSRQVEEVYSRMDKHFKGLMQTLENAGQTSSGAYRAVSNMTQNLDFLQQVNQMYTYVQLPLRLQQHNAHGDLYVYTNKKNLASKDGRVSALLHLDMDHLGPVDVYVSMQNEKVSTQFYVQDDSMLDFLSQHMDILTERLQKRGYDCSCKLQVRGEKENGEDGGSGRGGIHNLLSRGGNMTLAQYAFDVRA